MMTGESVVQAYNELLDGIQPLCDEFTSTAGVLRSLATTIDESAERGTTDVVSLMEKINASSQKVVDNIALIEGITFQANILALDDADEVPELHVDLDDLVNSVLRVDSILADIEAASDEQSSGIDRINKAIFHMDEVTQQSGALVEQAAAAAASLEEQAQSLLQTVSAFSMNIYLAHA